MAEFQYMYLERSGIQRANLKESLSLLKLCHIKNGLVLELSELINLDELSWNDVHEQFTKTCQKNFSRPALHWAVTDVKKKYIKLNKTRTGNGVQKLQEYLDKEFKVPKRKCENEGCETQQKKRRTTCMNEERTQTDELQENVKHRQNPTPNEKRINEKIKRLNASRQHWKRRCINAERQTRKWKEKSKLLRRLLTAEKRKRKTTKVKHIYIAQDTAIEECESQQDEHNSQIPTKCGKSYNAQIREASYYLQVRLFYNISLSYFHKNFSL